MADDAREEARRLLADAQALPTPEQIRELAEAAKLRSGMSVQEIRGLADEAMEQAERMTVLLRRLTGLLRDDGEAGDDSH